MAESYIFICSDRVFSEQFPFLFGALRFRNFFLCCQIPENRTQKKGMDKYFKRHHNIKKVHN